MNGYRVSFYEDLVNSDRHSFKCLQRRSMSNRTARRRRWYWQNGWSTLNADCVEVMHLTGHHEFEHPLSQSSAPCKHTWSRAS